MNVFNSDVVSGHAGFFQLFVGHFFFALHRGKIHQQIDSDVVPKYFSEWSFFEMRIVRTPLDVVGAVKWNWDTAVHHYVVLMPELFFFFHVGYLPTEQGKKKKKD